MPVLPLRPPKRATIWPHTDEVIAGNGLTGSTPGGSGTLFSYWPQVTPAINNERRNFFFLRSGTYTLRIKVLKTTSGGIATVYIDGVSQGTVDCYNNSTLESTLTISITVTTDGWHELRFIIASKNASSSNYNFMAECYDIF